MGWDYRTADGGRVRQTLLMHLLFSLLRYKDIVCPPHPDAEYCNIEGEHYLAKDLYEYAEAIIRVISALLEYNRDTPQKVDCWGDPIEETLSDADKVSSGGLSAYSPEMKAWANKQDWYLPAVLNSIVTNMTILGNCCRSAGLDSMVILD